jgi:hypothetical protein
LTDLQRKNIKEDLSNATEQQLANAKAAANKLIEAISTTPILKLPDFAREFVLYTDASQIQNQRWCEQKLPHIPPAMRHIAPSHELYAQSVLVDFPAACVHYAVGKKVMTHCHVARVRSR